MFIALIAVAIFFAALYGVSERSTSFRKLARYTLFDPEMQFITPSAD